MAQIKIKKAMVFPSGEQFFPITHTKAVIDDNGYTAESRLGAMQDEINQAQLAVGAVPSDLAPTEDSTNWVTSGGVFNATNIGHSVAFNLSDYSAIRAWITSTGIWNTQSSVYQYYGKFLPVTGGNKYKIIAGQNGAYYGFLLNQNYSHNAHVDFATYSERVFIEANETVFDTAPANAKFMWVGTLSDANIEPIAVISYNRICMQDVVNKLDDVVDKVIYDNKISISRKSYISTSQGVGNVCPMIETYYDVNDSAIIELNTGDELKIYSVGGSNSRQWAVLDPSTHEILSVAEANSKALSSPLPKTITAESNVIVIVNMYNESSSPKYGNTLEIPYSLSLIKASNNTVIPEGGVLGDMYARMSDISETVDSNAEAVKELLGGSEHLVTKDVGMTFSKYIPCNQGVGNVCPIEETDTVYSDCAVINLKGGEIIDIKGVGGNASRLWAVLDASTHEILSVASANTSTTISSPLSKTITAENDVIVIINVYNENANPSYGNTSNTPYSVKLSSMSTEGIIDNLADRIENLEQKNVFEMTVQMPSTASDFDLLWDKFVTDGLATRSEIASPNNSPVYLYHIDTYNKIAKSPDNSTFTILDNDYYQKKKLLIISGIHGNEKQTPLWLYEFINRILYNDEYAAFRATYDWYIVPMVNPTGYDANTRNNFNNVNINRDFIRKTQVETQAICNLIDNGSFDAFLDIHQLSGGSGSSSITPLVCSALILASGTPTAILNDMCVKFARGGSASDIVLNTYFNKSVVQSCYPWPPIQVGTNEQQSHEYAFEHGINESFSFEFTQYAYPFSGSNTRYNNGSMIYGNTVLHNLMMEFFGK